LGTQCTYIGVIRAPANRGQFSASVTMHEWR